MVWRLELGLFIAGHAFMRHAPDSSFPSDHGTVMFTAALVLASSAAPIARGWLRP